MPRPPILTLTTDFGHEGPYVAALKGVVLGRAPEAQIVDVTHAIAPQNLVEGAFVLAGLPEVFPEGTVHLAVIDPGVGTDRRLLAVEVAGHWFVLPDNGLISGVLRSQAPGSVRELTNLELRRPRVSATFHGRDILAPAAAHLLVGGDPARLGPEVDPNSLVLLRDFEPIEAAGELIGEVVSRDVFGNLITNLGAERLAGTPAGAWSVAIAGRTIQGLSRTYGEQPSGTLVALVGSGGWIEVALVNGDAARSLGAGRGATVRLRRETPR